MEILLTLIGEFVIAPVLSAIVQVSQFMFWMCCWVVVGLFRSFVAAGRGIRALLP